MTSPLSPTRSTRGPEHERLRGAVDSRVNEPTDMPWGNRSLLLRDPDGDLVNLFTPVTPEAIAKFARFLR